MFGGGDPFGNPFQFMQRQMEQMEEFSNNMFNNMMGGGPFGMFGGPPRHPNNMMIDNQQHRRQRNDMISPFGEFGFGGGLFGGMMQQMERMQDFAINDPNSMVFSQSTMVSYDGNGEPRIVQNSTRKVGDVKETRKAVRDGDKERVTVGHHIGDRTHVIEKKRDRDGKIRQEQKFYNLNEDEAENFNHEFKNRASRNVGSMFGRNNSQQRAIENDSKRNNRSNRGISNGSGSSVPIITIPDDEEDTRHRAGRSRLQNEDETYVRSNTRGGPSIREIDEDDMDENDSNKRRRKGVFSKILRD